MKDLFDSLCECVLIDCPREDQVNFNHVDSQHYQEFKRRMVNAGKRQFVADADCQVCNGSGRLAEQVAS